MQYDASLPITMSENGGTARYLTADELSARAARAERNGYAGLFTAETNTDPFLPLVVAAGATSAIELGTSIAVEFARSPMTTAQTAHQLQGVCDGRFVLGLGTQIKPHITRRFGMPWSKPVSRMEAHIDAIRAIWHTWRTGDRLDFRSEFFSLNLMNQQFTPPSHGHPDPPVMISAVGPAMTDLAARKADGIFTHPFSSAGFLAEVTIPKIEQRLEELGRDRSRFRIQASVMRAVGETPEELELALRTLRRRIAFYASTPAYHGVLEHHGWSDLGPRLHALSTTSDPNRWSAMADLLPDEVVETIGIIGDPASVRAEEIARYGDVVDRLRG